MAWFERGASRIYYEDESTGGDTALLLPGLTDSIESHRPLREALKAAGYRVVAADLPGSGRSQPQPRIYTVDYYQEDAASMAALLDHLAIESAHLIGFSDGGEVSLLMAVNQPRLARSVVTWGSAGQIKDDSGQLRAMFASVIDNPAPPLREFSEHLVATYGRDIARTTTQNAVRAMTEIIESRGGDLSLSRAVEIAAPVLLIGGEHDPLAAAPLVAELASRIKHARVEQVKGGGHDLHHSNGDWLIATVLDWLKQPAGAH